MKEFLNSEWKRRSKELTKKLEAYNEEYRIKHTNGKTIEQLENDGWRLVDGELYCDKMHKARVQKFKKEIDDEMWFKFALHRIECRNQT